MRIGRLILTHRQDLVGAIKEIYLPARTGFLVIAYNQACVDPAQFSQTENFKLFPYTGPGGSIAGHQYKVWKDVVKQFPGIDAWTIHDYDVLVKPADEDIFRHVKPGQYAALGLPFYNWQQGMPAQTTNDTFPYLSHYVDSISNKDSTFLGAEQVLKKAFPLYFQNIATIKTGYSDFFVGFSKDLILFDNPKLDIAEGGIDQVVHTVMAYHKIELVDLRQFYSMEISLDNTLYMPFENKFDISHTAKFWPQGNLRPGFKLALKRLIKLFVTSAKYRRSYPTEFKVKK